MRRTIVIVTDLVAVVSSAIASLFASRQFAEAGPAAGSRRRAEPRHSRLLATASARKMGVPFASFLTLGGVVALFAGQDLLDAYLAPYEPALRPL